MTKNRRYEAHFDALNDERVRNAPMTPCTLPQQAYGPRPFDWSQRPQPVWAWITWPNRPAERIACFATGWNDRVVVVKWYQDPGGAVETVVWRNAVTRRTTGQTVMG